jgi:uncharacterized protein YfaS (alpha-2-macroglobulin family)
MDSSLRSHAASLLAFSGETGEKGLTQKLLNGLLNRAQNGQWGNTQENVFGIMSVASTVLAQGEVRVDDLELLINDRPVSIAKMESTSPRVKRIAIPTHDLGLAEGRRGTLKIRLRNSLGKPVHLTARLEYKEKLTAANRAPVSKGFTISRKVLDLQGRSLKGSSIKLGQVVRIRLRVGTGEKRNYVAIDDKLPAGLEALNAALANTGTVTSGKLNPEGVRGLQNLSHHELRDERVVFFVDEMAAGSYEYEYLARATTAGTFTRPAASVEAMYDPQAMARTSIDTVEIK